MIHSIRASHESFHSVVLSAGFNVILADRTKESTKKDSRNGLGKTKLIEIVHFCLGASSQHHGLRNEALRGWSFSLDLDLGGRHITVTRGVDRPGEVRLEGDFGGLEVDDANGHLSLKDWTILLGEMMFGIPRSPNRATYSPSFRSLISYFVRPGRDAFSSPFEHHRRQREWDRQVHNTYLLGLSWRNAKAWQELKDQKKVLDNLKKAVDSDLVQGVIGNLGELEAERVRLEEVLRRQKQSLDSFKVHPEYREIELQASELTSRIHELSNQNVSDRRLLEDYRESLREVDDRGDESIREVETIYAKAGVQLPGAVVRRLEDVRTFHETLVANRKSFLSAELEDIESAIADREETIRRLSDRRAELMKVLADHGALDEYTELQQRYSRTGAQLKDVENRIENLRKLEQGKSSLKIEQERLHQSARRDYDERHELRERAISLFNAHSQALYEAPGRLVINIGDTGFKFDVEIERAGAQGIENMKVFCYDLTLAQLWAEKSVSPGFLIHDSTIFDGVDERQVALALERAAEVSEEAGFQYVCTLNSDTLPLSELSEGFNIHQFVRLRLTDATPKGSLFGFRF